MAYTSTSFMFRSLDDREEAEFRAYAREHDPSNDDWSIYHPVCREEWIKRGLLPGKDPLLSEVED